LICEDTPVGLVGDDGGLLVGIDIDAEAGRAGDGDAPLGVWTEALSGGKPSLKM
jgi:hypothetical protein